MVNNFVYFIRYLVIQRSFATKDLGSIKRVFTWMFSRLFATL